jgi:hypothetical protein
LRAAAKSEDDLGLARASAHARVVLRNDEPGIYGGGCASIGVKP